MNQHTMEEATHPEPHPISPRQPWAPWGAPPPAVGSSLIPECSVTNAGQMAALHFFILSSSFSLSLSFFFYCNTKATIKKQS